MNITRTAAFIPQQLRRKEPTLAFSTLCKAEPLPESWKRVCNAVELAPNAYRDATDLSKNVAFFKASQTGAMFPSFTMAQIEAQSLRTLDIKHDTHYQDDGFNTADKDGRRDLGRLSVMFDLTKSIPDKRTAAFIKDFPHTSQLILEGTARLGLFLEKPLDEIESAVTRILIYRPGWNRYTHAMHSDGNPALHIPLLSDKCTGITTFQDTHTNPTFKEVGHDEISANKDLPHEVTVTATGADPLRILVNIMIH